SPVASAQIKSSILLAGLYADGETSVTEPYLSRNHTELMFRHFGIDISSEKNTATVKPPEHFEGQKVIIPGDISSAAYFIAAGLITPNSEILIKNVGINKTRDGIIKVALEMGGNISIINRHMDAGEETADILVKSSTLHGTIISGDIIPTLIDEIPIIAVMACFAKGTTIIKDAAELKVKESNRIDTVVNNLKLMNADVCSTDDGMIINTSILSGCEINSYMDHRIAMAFSIAGLNADGDTTIKNFECVNISYPEFYNDLLSL
ncbi:MAG: 3-phosphoshikimate 1-carboxyvinyltransferase, partial [Eubacterium sp.]